MQLKMLHQLILKNLIENQLLNGIQIKMLQVRIQNQKQKKNSKISTKPILLYLIQIKEKNMMLVDMMMIQVAWVVDTVELVEQTLHRYFKCSLEEEEVVILLEEEVVIAIAIMEEDKEIKDNNFFNKTLEEWVVIPSNLNFNELINFIYIYFSCLYKNSI